MMPSLLCLTAHREQHGHLLGSTVGSWFRKQFGWLGPPGVNSRPRRRFPPQPAARRHVAGTRETRFKQLPRSDSRATQGGLAAGSCSVKAGDPWKQRGSRSEQTYGSVPGQKVGGVEVFLQEIGWEAEALPS